MPWSINHFISRAKIEHSSSLLANYFSLIDLIIITISLVLLLAGWAFLFESANEWVLWKYDDTEHLSIAFNLFSGKGLTKDFIDLESNTVEKNIPSLQKYEDISNPLRSKLPLYFILLGAWLHITSSNFTSWYFNGSIFNLILSSICIVVFYFFVKKYFGLKIASFSASLLAMMPGFIWYSVRIRPDVLAFIFTILSIYYAAKKITYKNAVYCGIFVSLAHLSHPIGLIPGSAILIYFVIKKKIREASLLVIVWCLISIPWLVRNYLVLGDATQGFGLPIPRSILLLLGLISPDSTITNAGDVGSLFGISIVKILDGMLNEFVNLYGMNYFLVLVLFSVIAYINMPYLKNLLRNKNKKIIICFGIGIYSSLLIYTIFFESDDINIFRQTIILFLVPLVLFLYIKLFSKHKNIFTVEGHPAYMLIGLFVIISFIPYIMFAQIAGRSVPEIRIIIQSLYLLIPLAFLGISKILNDISPLKKIKKNYLIFPCVAIIVLSISGFQMSQGINLIDNLQKNFAEKEFQQALDNWVANNIPANAKIASDLPHAILLKTGHPSVNFAHLYKDKISYEEWIIKKFDIDYFVFYYFKDNIPHDLVNLDLPNFDLLKIYEGNEGGLVYKIIEKE